MKNWMLNRILSAEQQIAQEIKHAIKYKYAHNINRTDMLNRVIEHVDVKSMPNKYKEQIRAIFDFMWHYEITPNILFPVEWKGQLYSKWKNMPDGLKGALHAGYDMNGNTRTKPIFKWHFSEGMKPPWNKM